MKTINKVMSRNSVLVAGLLIGAATQAALVGHWTFDETSGTTAFDSSGNGYNGTAVNPVWTSGVDGGGALDMNGTDCQVSGFGDVLSTVSDELTISFWCAGDLSNPQNMNGFSGYAGSTRMLNVHLPNGTTVYFDAAYSEGTTGVRDRISKYVGSADASVLRGPWNYWTFTKNAASGYMAIYLNGALWHDSSATGPFNGSMGGITDFIIGSDGGSSAFYKGLMDDFRVYDNELSAAEIANLYNAVEPDYAIAYASATPEFGSIPLEVVFDGSSSVSSGSITNYYWDFGDGTTGEGISVAHSYTETNIYTVTLTVTDDSGNMDSAQFEIEAKIPPAAELDYTVESSDFEEFPAFSTNDLAQIYYLSSSGTKGNDSRTTTDTQHAKLFDGLIMGTIITNNDETAFVMWDSGASVTVDFDVSVNTLGYDITNIVSIAGWTTGSKGRSNQGYEVEVTYVDDSKAILAEATNWAPNNPTFYWTRVSIFEASHNVMATGVKSVTFNFSEDANPGGRVMGREIDIHGYPTKATVPDVPVIALINDDNSLTWNANGDFIYTVQSKLNLMIGSSWETVTNAVGTPPTTTVVLPPQNEHTEFYRVIVE
ncbi:PKD domain-containing protein [Pontiellaceae bacterium B1224]|nr:PKD domain-containing protein [Pontiellaceae bacterium B1224]